MEFTETLKGMVGTISAASGPSALGRSAKALGKSISVIDEAIALMNTAESIWKIGAAFKQIKLTSAQAEKELGNLTDGLLPLQRNLSDQLDGLMKTPLMQNLKNGMMQSCN